MHKDFEYKLWTDESSLAFIKEHYPWFLPTYLGYQFNIQRADAIRYFVLHKYGGVYLDLDVGGFTLSLLHPLPVIFATTSMLNQTRRTCLGGIKEARA